ncbi:MAG: DUF2157 domain-containing protein [Bacteroidota bacterium]
MNDAKHYRWMLEKLPSWVDQQLIDQGAADRLKVHAEPHVQGSGPNPAFLLTGILGALLIGSGIISLFAYNWDSFSRMTRALLSVLPVLLGVAAYSYAFLKKADSPAWMESTSGFLMLMLAASISLVAQTYNIPGSLQGFLFTWMLLSIPLLWLSQSTLTALIYLTGITVWTADAGVREGMHFWYWAWLLPLVPHLWFSFRTPSEKTRRNILGWATGISLFSVSFPLFDLGPDIIPTMTFGAIMGLLYVAGRVIFGEATYPWTRPWQTLAIGGIYVMSMLLAFEWYGLNLENGTVNFGGSNLPEWVIPASWTVIGSLIAATIGLGLWFRKKGGWLNFFPAAFPLVVALGVVMLETTRDETLSLILMNLYLMAYGIFYLREGIRQERLGLVNMGMFFLSSLLVGRFFDEDISFLVKGLAFLLIGGGFLGVNYYLYKKKQQHA